MDYQGLRRSKLDDENYSHLDKASSTIYIVGDISMKVASQFRQHIRTLERLKKNSVIQVEINSLGGDIEAGMMIVDSIMLCKKPVITRVTGVAMSMGAAILVAGEKREALPNSTIMLHQGSYRVSAEHRSFKVEVSECDRIEQLLNDYLDKRTGKEPGYWKQRHDGKNLYLTAEQALVEGVIDTIVGKV